LRWEKGVELEKLPRNAVKRGSMTRLGSKQVQETKRLGLTKSLGYVHRDHMDGA